MLELRIGCRSVLMNPSRTRNEPVIDEERSLYQRYTKGIQKAGN